MLAYEELQAARIRQLVEEPSLRQQANKINLLYIGDEPALSKASSTILRRAGYCVRIAKPDAAAHLLRDLRFSAVVLCVTLSREASDSIVHQLEAFCPGVPIIGVCLGHLGDAPHPACAVSADVLQGPEPLLRAVHGLAHHHPALH